MIRYLLGSLLCFSLSCAHALELRSPVTQTKLLELYTSEGCSSCPPADRWLSGFKDDARLWQQVVPVAFHVDYWDYIGWPDRFATAAYGERQHSYATVAGLRTVYTPGVLLAGKEWRRWVIDDADAFTAGPPVGELAVSVDANALTARFAPVTPAASWELHVAVLGFELSTEVDAGENSGRHLQHDFVVLGYQRLPLTAINGIATVNGTLPTVRAAAPRQALAVWVSRRNDPRPLQAVGGWLSI